MVAHAAGRGWRRPHYAESVPKAGVFEEEVAGGRPASTNSDVLGVVLKAP